MAVVEQQLPGSFINLLHGWNALVVGVSLIVSDTLWLVIKGNEGDYWNFKNAREAGRRMLAGSCHTQTKISLTVDIFPVCFVLKPTETGCETDRKYIDNQDPRQD